MSRDWSGVVVVGLIMLVSFSFVQADVETYPQFNSLLLKYGINESSTLIVDGFDNGYGSWPNIGDEIGTLSGYWNHIGTNDIKFTLQDNGFSSRVGFFSDLNVSAAEMITRIENTQGSLAAGDWVQISFYNATGAGTGGCIFGAFDSSGTGIGIVVINSGALYAYDNAVPVELDGSVSSDAWHTLRFKPFADSTFEVTYDGTTYGPYTIYGGDTWDDDILKGIEFGTIYGLEGDTCEVWLDNYTNSWTPANNMRFYMNHSYFWDRPTYGVWTDGNPQLFLDGVYEYATGSSANVYVDEYGNLYRSTSSIEQKEDVEDISDASVFEQIIPKSYVYETDGKESYGFIAEEVAAADIRLADYNSRGEAVNVNTNALLAVLYAKVRELSDRLDRVCGVSPELCK